MKVFMKQLNICPMRRVNMFQYREALLQHGHEIVETPEEADKLLIWTCAVREDFHDNSMLVLQNYEKQGFEVIAAGCLPSINPELIQQKFNGQIIHYNNDDEEFQKIFGISLESAPYPVAEAPIVIPLEQYKKEHPGVKVAHDDQYIKLFISEGCTRKCSYCTEVKAFPPYQSYPLQKIVTKAADIVARTGVKKIGLYGDDIGAYGVDCHSSLIELVDALTAIDPDIQISLKQIHPLSWKHHHAAIQERINEKKIFQLLVPIQSANSRVLALMKRDYSADDLHFLFAPLLQNTDLELETHIIAGFPTETDSEWEETVDFVCQYRFRYVMGNIFMPGPGTEAASMDGQISNDEKVRRMLSGADKMEAHGTVVGHNLSWRQKEHLTHERVDFTEL